VNLGSLKTNLQRYGFDTSDPLQDWINEALHTFEDAYPWPFLEISTTVSVVANNDIVPLPADFSLLIAEPRFTTESVSLQYIGVRDLEEQGLDPTSVGLPTRYYFVGPIMRLWPIPDISRLLRITYHRKVADLTTDGQSPTEIPTKYHYTIVYGAASVALDTEDENDRATKAEDKFQQRISAAIDYYSKKQLASFGQVRDSQGYADGTY